MKVKTRCNTLILLFICALSFAQLDTYDYKMELSGITDPWHSLIIPQEVFAIADNNLSDIRIYGVTANDTLEAPYILKVATDKKRLKNIDFKLINSAIKKDNYFFTFEIPKIELINEILLDFKNENFDWKIVLEASQDQKDWFTILRDYRILSIKNNQTDYKFTQLNISPSKYKYYRIAIQSDTKPELNKATISFEEKVELKYKDYSNFDIESTEDDENAITEIQIDLDQRYPLSMLKLNVGDTFDYYRPISIQYAADSVKSEKGWRYHYQTLFNGTLNSIEENEFKFSSTLAKKLNITIQNHDNQPLEILGVEVKGLEHQLIARFTKDANYYLAYGKENDRNPNYDITRSLTKIPESMTALSLGSEQAIPKKLAKTKNPLFENKLWLWTTMGLIILVLGAFTLKMMSKK